MLFGNTIFFMLFGSPNADFLMKIFNSELELLVIRLCVLFLDFSNVAVLFVEPDEFDFIDVDNGTYTSGPVIDFTTPCNSLFSSVFLLISFFSFLI